MLLAPVAGAVAVAPAAAPAAAALAVCGGDACNTSYANRMVMVKYLLKHMYSTQASKRVPFDLMTLFIFEVVFIYFYFLNLIMFKIRLFFCSVFLFIGLFNGHLYEIGRGTLTSNQTMDLCATRTTFPRLLLFSFKQTVQYQWSL